jgi:hypothetical protein
MSRKKRRPTPLGFLAGPRGKLHRYALADSAGGSVYGPCANARKTNPADRRDWFGQPIHIDRVCRLCFPELHKADGRNA